MAAAESRESVVLNSWKEIASFVGRGVRTVQRWEAECGMPIHRPRGHSRSAVLAFSDELEAWLRSDRNPERPTDQKLKTQISPAAHRGHLVHAAKLRERCVTLCAENERALNAFLLNLRQLIHSVHEARKMRLCSSQDQISPMSESSL